MFDSCLLCLFIFRLNGFSILSSFYSPYEHLNFPYEHQTSPSENHPYNQAAYCIPVPAIQLTYGFPNIPPKQPSATELPEVLSNDLTVTNPTTTTTTNDPSIIETDITTILTGDSLTKLKKRSIAHLQPQLVEAPTTVPHPRARHNDDSKWRIIRQDGNKKGNL